MENMHVDLILRDLKRVKNVIEQTGRGEVSFHYQTGHPHACANVMYRGEMAVCRVLYAKCQKLYALQNEARVYPDIMRENLLNHCMFEAGFSLSIARSTLPPAGFVLYRLAPVPRGGLHESGVICAQPDILFK